MADPVLELQQEEKLVVLWPDYPSLYDVRSSNFKNRQIREASINELATKVGQSAEWIKKKIKIFRNTFSRIRASGKSGSERKNLSPRNQWLKEKLVFLEPFVATRGNTIDTLTPPLSSSSSSSLDSVLSDNELADELSGDEIETNPPPKKTQKCGQKKKSKKNQREEEEMEILKKIANSASEVKEKMPDKYQLFGQFVAESIKELDDTTRHVVQHRISSILFEAQMQGVSRPTPAPHQNEYYYSENSQYSL